MKELNLLCVCEVLLLKYFAVCLCETVVLLVCVCLCECECVCVCSGSRGVIAVYWSPAAWCLRNEGVSSVLLGASNTDQLMENIGAIQVRPQRSVCVYVCVCVCLYECTQVCLPAEHISGIICENMA